MYSLNIKSHKNEEFVIGGLLYNASNQCLSSSSKTVYLRNKLNEVLFHMVSNPDRVVSRNELIEKVWHGNYYTGVKGVTHTVCKLRKTLSVLGSEQIKIQTLPKRGYTLSIMN